MKTLLLGIALMVVSMGSQSAESTQDVEDFIAEYLRLWNAGDSATIAERIFRFDAPHPFAKRQGLQAEFDRLKSSGYSHSNTLGVKACWINANQALVELRYSRINTDGTVMLPKERSTLYFVRKTAEGLRINNLIAMSPGAKVSCTSSDQSVVR